MRMQENLTINTYDIDPTPELLAIAELLTIIHDIGRLIF